MNEPVNLYDFESRARARLPEATWDYYAGGADDEGCLRRNTSAFERIALHYRVLVDVSTRDLSTTIAGARTSMPILVAPTAFHRLAHDEGEIASVQGAGDAGAIFVLSTMSNTAVEDVVAAASGPVWFQLYLYKDRAATEALVRRAEAAGCSALVLTVDAPCLGRRERDIRNRFSLPPDLALENLLATRHARMMPSNAGSALALFAGDFLDPSLTWKDVEWLRSVTRLPVFVKGVVRVDDAHRAVAAGAAGIIVSNHGGRQLDAAPSSIDVLPRIADAVGGRAEILVDGGVRRGSDVLKAIALGASGVLIGRPILWGLAADGRAGVATVLAMLRRELDLVMALCGCPDLVSVTRDLVHAG